MAQITWRNINAPDLGDPLAALARGGNQLTKGIDSLRDELTRYQETEQQNWDTVKTNNTNQLLAEVAALQDMQSYDAYRAGIGQKLAGMGAQVNGLDVWKALNGADDRIRSDADQQLTYDTKMRQEAQRAAMVPFMEELNRQTTIQGGDAYLQSVGQRTDLPEDFTMSLLTDRWDTLRNNLEQNRASGQQATLADQRIAQGERTEAQELINATQKPFVDRYNADIMKITDPSKFGELRAQISKSTDLNAASKSALLGGIDTRIQSLQTQGTNKINYANTVNSDAQMKAEEALPGQLRNYLLNGGDPNSINLYIDRLVGQSNDLRPENIDAYRGLGKSVLDTLTAGTKEQQALLAQEVENIDATPIGKKPDGSPIILKDLQTTAAQLENQIANISKDIPARYLEKQQRLDTGELTEKLSELLPWAEDRWESSWGDFTREDLENLIPKVEGHIAKLYPELIETVGYVPSELTIGAFLTAGLNDYSGDDVVSFNTKGTQVKRPQGEMDLATVKAAAETAYEEYVKGVQGRDTINALQNELNNATALYNKTKNNVLTGLQNQYRLNRLNESRLMQAQ